MEQSLLAYLVIKGQQWEFYDNTGDPRWTTENRIRTYNDFGIPGNELLIEAHYFPHRMVDRNVFQYFKNWYGIVRSDDLEGTLLEQEKLRLFYDWIIGQNGCLFSNQYNTNRL